MIRIQKAGYHGIYLPDYRIGFDYSGPHADYYFVSHAHADHMPRSARIEAYATPPTAEFLRLRGFKGTVKPLPFYEKVETPRATVRFFPAGHILGSAMTYVETEEGTVLYTGDYRTPAAAGTEGFEMPEPVDHFITEATFGMPIYRWPEREELDAMIRNFALDALDGGYTPVFLGYSLGKSQEIMHILSELNHPMQVHGAGHKLCPVYEKYGINLGSYEAYDRDTAEGKILITPSSGLGNGLASNISKKRIAYCSGWATLESRRTQLTVDRLIPLSDHLDFFELMKLCRRLEPEKVYITHTPNPKILQHFLRRHRVPSTFLDAKTQTDAED